MNMEICKMTREINRISRWCSSCVALLCLVVVLGCGAKSGIEAPTNLVEVTGTVTLNGEPLDGANVYFTPQSDTKGVGGFALTDVDGKFTALHFSRSPGLEPGNYDVTFSKIAMADGTSVPEGEDPVDFIGAREIIPAYLSQVQPRNNKYQLTVSDTPQTISYELNSKRQ